MTFPLVTTNIFRVLVFTLIFSTISVSLAVEPASIKWEKELGPAKARAAAENKPMILHFYFDTCPPCQLMERDILSHPKVIEKVNADFVAVKINTTQSPQLMAQYDVIMAPTDVYLSPDGKVVHTRGGKPTFDQFATEITQVAAKFPKPQLPAPQIQQMVIAQNQPQPLQSPPANFAGYVAANPVNQVPPYQPAIPSPPNDSEGFAVSGQNGNSPPNTVVVTQLQQLQQQQTPHPVVEQQIPQSVQQPTYTPTTPPTSPVVGTFENGSVHKQPVAGMGAGTSLGIVAAVNEKPMVAPLPTIALDGYCPVSLAHTAKWVKGNAEITMEFEGIIFRFASIEARDTFAANPALYAPVLRGNDAVELLIDRREVPGQRKFGAWYHGKVFLFTNAENYAKFLNNPELYAIQIQQSNNSLAVSRPSVY